ncbi:hypothetical protein CCH79_00003839 [Gambusia affinis]|uniref:Uncharacterized protein n=1 Tax=Gambusia affinis TaxID=33528 RepID=A0A315VAM9_GAMAF|nr:hypothetical protein CCH79_00003839 [Gambusia affinis]
MCLCLRPLTEPEPTGWSEGISICLMSPQTLPWTPTRIQGRFLRRPEAEDEEAAEGEEVGAGLRVEVLLHQKQSQPVGVGVGVVPRDQHQHLKPETYFRATSQRSQIGESTSSAAEEVIIDDSDEDIPVMKATRPTPRFVLRQHLAEKSQRCISFLLASKLNFVPVKHRSSSLSSSSFPRYSSQSQSQTSRGVAFEDSDEEDNPFKGHSREEPPNVVMYVSPDITVHRLTSLLLLQGSGREREREKDRKE